MRIVVFSGTTEGRRLSAALADLGAQVTVCVATEYGAEEQGELPGIQVHIGRLDEAGMCDLIRHSDLCIDATHPYAVAATANIRQAAAQVGVACRRMLRAPSILPQNSRPVQDAASAAALLRSTIGPVLLTTGVKELPAFAGLDPVRLYPRVLPLIESLRACEAAGIPHRNIIAMQGPFTRELNIAMIRQFGIRYLVTKDGGVQGGFREKAEAARDTGITLVVIRRPKEDGRTEAEILEECRGLLV